jgi:hypothetical protein
MKPGELVRGEERRFDAAILRLLPDGSVQVEGRILSRHAEEEIERCLRGFHADVLKEERREVVVDVRHLEWITESAVTALVRWVLRIQRESFDKRYGVVFRINTSVPWQHGTFKALLAVAPNVVSIEAS